MGNFEDAYVTTNNRPGAAEYDAPFMNRLSEELVRTAPELEPIRDAILASLSIGAHRPDFIPHILERTLKPVVHDEAEAYTRFEHLRSVVMVVWPFVGIPWCVPACLGMANVLSRYDLLSIAETPRRTEIGEEHKSMGQSLLERTYANVQNDEVRQMLRSYFTDFSTMTWTVVFGYSMAGTTALGVYEEKQTQLILASAIAASGATRQARSHLKASMGLGNSADAVKAVLAAAEELNRWNGVELPTVSIDGI